jgi:hypothetical protein
MKVVEVEEILKHHIYMVKFHKAQVLKQIFNRHESSAVAARAFDTSIHCHIESSHMAIRRYGIINFEGPP